METFLMHIRQMEQKMTFLFFTVIFGSHLLNGETTPIAWFLRPKIIFSPEKNTATT